MIESGEVCCFELLSYYIGFSGNRDLKEVGSELQRHKGEKQPSRGNVSAQVFKGQ